VWLFNATHRPLLSRERPGTHCIRGWVCPRAGLDRCRKYPLGFVPQTVQPVASRYTDWPLPAHFMSVHSAPHICRAVVFHTHGTFHLLHTTIFHSTTCFGHPHCSYSIIKTQTAFQQPIRCLCLYNILAPRCVAETCSNVKTYFWQQLERRPAMYI
jgi:hypothetical protein